MLTEVSRGLKWQQKCRDPGEVRKPVTDHLLSTGKTKWRVTGVDPCVSQWKQQKGECGTINFPGLKKNLHIFQRIHDTCPPTPAPTHPHQTSVPDRLSTPAFPLYFSGELRE